MSFQKPGLLWLLLALLVPLVLYLLPLPRRRVMSSGLFLWERFLQSEPLGRTTERFRRVLGFALLAVILAALVTAAAELRLGWPAVSARRLVVVLDASASMNAVRDGHSNLDRAKRAAAELIASLSTRTQTAVAEAAGRLRLIRPWGPAGRQAADAVAAVEPFDGAVDLSRVLDETFDLWGADEECELNVFTDAPLPESRWGQRARSWLAPPAGDNAGVIALTVERRGKNIRAQFTLANYGQTPRTLAGAILVMPLAEGPDTSPTRQRGSHRIPSLARRASVPGAVPRRTFQTSVLKPGETIEQQAIIEEIGAATLSVRLDGGPDALSVDDEAWILVPGLEELGVHLVWPPGGKHNAYVSTVLAALQEQGIVGPIAENPDGVGAVTVLVNQAFEAWPAGGAIVLHPLRPGAFGVSGHQPEPATVTRQAPHVLLEGVKLRGLVVKDAVRTELPPWAEPLIWAGDLPLVWAGETANRKALVVAMPLTTDSSRWPLSASFPVLLRNACLWMLPRPSVLRPGEMTDGWTSRRAGLIASPRDGRPLACSTLSPAESDLRRGPAVPEESPVQHRSLAFVLVALALGLLPLDWRLFHRRFTE